MLHYSISEHIVYRLFNLNKPNCFIGARLFLGWERLPGNQGRVSGPSQEIVLYIKGYKMENKHICQNVELLHVLGGRPKQIRDGVQAWPCVCSEHHGSWMLCCIQLHMVHRAASHSHISNRQACHQCAPNTSEECVNFAPLRRGESGLVL